MRLIFMPEAELALMEIGNWVESKNTPGSGYRFIDKLIDKIESFVLPEVTYDLCKNEELALLGLHCLAIEKWVVAFKIEKQNFTVCYIILGSGLK